jgi:hypothetical protein
MMLAVGVIFVLTGVVLMGYAHGYQRGKVDGLAEGSTLLHQTLPAWTVETDEDER